MHNSLFQENILFIIDSTTIDKKTIPILCSPFISASFNHSNIIIKKILDYIQKKESDIVGIIGLDEEYKYKISKKISSYFNLPYYNQTTIDLLTNKYKQRISLQQTNLPVPQFTILNPFDFNFNNIQAMPFPNVLKPISGISSKFVYLNHNEFEITKNISDFKSKKCNLNKESLLLEEYIRGNEYSCDFLVQGNFIKIIRVVKKITNQKNFASFNGFFLFNPYSNTLAELKIDSLLKACETIASTFQINRGVCMIDFKIYHEKIYIIETTIRPGISQFIELMIALNQHTSFDILIKQILHIENPITNPLNNGAIIYIKTNKKGLLTKFDCSLLEKNPHIHSVKKYYEEGEKISQDTQTFSKNILLGHAIFININEQDIPFIIKKVHQQVIITTT